MWSLADMRSMVNVDVELTAVKPQRQAGRLLWSQAGLGGRQPACKCQSAPAHNGAECNANLNKDATRNCACHGSNAQQDSDIHNGLLVSSRMCHLVLQLPQLLRLCCGLHGHRGSSHLLLRPHLHIRHRRRHCRLNSLDRTHEVRTHEVRTSSLYMVMRHIS